LATMPINNPSAATHMAIVTITRSGASGASR
jgi:hypothetical protein